MTKVIANLLLATRLAVFQLWRMKLRALVAILVIAIPASGGLILATKYLMEERTKTSAQVLGYDKYETRFQRWHIDQDNFADIDRKIKAIAGDDTVSILMSPLGTARELQGSSRDAEWILWGPQEGALPQTSRLVSGRWPQTSREVLVSDVAVREGAASTGTVSLVVDAAPAEDYTIVGVGRTVIGEQHSKYTSVIDERIAAVGSVRTDRQRNLWLVPGKTLSQDKIKQVEAHGVVAGVRKDVRATTGAWTGVLFGVFPLTLLACLVVTQVFLHGLGRMRQSVNTIVQNGGSTATALTYSLMQGVILGVLAALIVMVVGLSTVAYVLSSPAPSTHPLHVELRSIPAGLLPGLALLIVCCTAAMSTIAAATARQSNTSHQAKTYTAKQADFDLMVPPVSKWVTVLGVLLIAGLSGAAVVHKIDHDPGEVMAGSQLPLMAVLALVVLVLGLGVVYPVVLHIMGRLRQTAHRRGLIGPAVRQSLGAGSRTVSLCALVTVITTLIALQIVLDAPAYHDKSGWSQHSVGKAQQGDYTSVLSQIQGHPEFKNRRLDTIYGLPSGGNSQSQHTARHQLVRTHCQLRSGRNVTEQSEQCRSDLGHHEKVAIADDATLRTLYRVSEAQLTELRKGAALQLFHSRYRVHQAADTRQLQLVRVVPSTSGDNSDEVVQKVVDVEELRYPREGLPLSIPRPYFVMSVAWFKEEGIPVTPTEIMIRSRTPFTKDQFTWISLVTGDYSGREWRELNRWPNYGYVRVYVSLAVLLGAVVALSSFGLAGSLATMRTLGHGYWRRFRLVAVHSLFGGLVASVLASAMAVVIALTVWLPQALVRPDYLINFQSGYLWLLVVGLLIPLSACLVALPVTWLWSLTGARSASTDITGSLKPVFGVFVLLVVLCFLRMSGVW